MYNIKRKVQFTFPAPRTFITPLSHYYCTVTISVLVMYRRVPQLIVVCDLRFKLCCLKCVLWVRMASSWRNCNGNGSFVFCLTGLGLIPIYPDNWGMTEVPTSLSYWYSKSKNISYSYIILRLLLLPFIKKGKYACLLKYKRCID